MTDYIQALASLENYDPQVLDAETLDRGLQSLKQQILKTEAAKVLLPAKEVPFSRLALGRLASLLCLVFKPEKQQEQRIIALRGLDSVSLVICGLCLTQKAIDSIKRELFDVVLEQAILASRACVREITTNEEIKRVVLKSVTDDAFLTSYLSLGRMSNSSTVWSSLQYSLAGNPSWYYSKFFKPVSAYAVFPHLLKQVVPGYITTFLPSEASTDGLIRFALPFDHSVLRNLFGWAGTGAIAAEHFSVGCAVRNQVEPVFGIEVFDAICSSHLWSQDNGEIETRCVKGDIFPGQFIVISLIVGWTSCYNFVNAFYIL